MRRIKTDGRLQVMAGVSLLENSKLVQWNADSGKFTPLSLPSFRQAHKAIDPVFGRLICWISFSGGAEFLAKGVCFLHGVDLREIKGVPAYPNPNQPLEIWVADFVSGSGTLSTTTFGTLGTPFSKHLKTLCDRAGATDEQRRWLLATYELLGSTIRNRDAHAYVPNVPDSHFELVSDLFARCFDLLVSWLPDGSVTVISGGNRKRRASS